MTAQFMTTQLRATSINQQKAIDAFLKVDVLFLGGAMFGGKSFLAAMLSTFYATDPSSRIAVFRSTLEQMKKGGAIIDTFKTVYKLTGDNCKLRVGGNPPKGKIYKGPGAGTGPDDCCTIDFIQMSKESDMEAIRGSAFTLSIIEEALPNFTQEQIEMIIARTRTNAPRPANSLRCKTLITGNPDPDHFLCALIKDFYLDEEGYARQDRCGVVRYYFKHQGLYLWGDSRAEVVDLAEEAGYEFLDRVTGEPLSQEDKESRVTSFSFVQLTARDNPEGVKNNPSYMAALEAMDDIKKARNLYGNWFLRPQNSTYFRRESLLGESNHRVKSIKDIPKGCVAVRGIDRAYTEPHEGNSSPNYTAFSPLILRSRVGEYYLLGNYHKDCIDLPYNKVDKPVLGRVRRNVGERNRLIVKQGLLDQELASVYGYNPPKMAIAVDSGGNAGDYTFLRAELEENGVRLEADVKSSNVQNKKLIDFLPFSSAVFDGRVFLVMETFSPDTLEAFFKELEMFDGETKSSRTRFDDWVDAMSIAFNVASTYKPYTTIVRNHRSSPTLVSNLKESFYD